MDNALQTLFYPFEQELLAPPQAQQNAVFLGARDYNALGGYEGVNWHFAQDFKPYAAPFLARGFTLNELPDAADMVLALPGKNKQETQAMLARGVSVLSGGGILIVSAANDAGGARIQKMLHALGLDDVAQESKNKCRVVWGVKGDAINQETLKEWLALGELQSIADGQFMSQPGIYGWDKIDQGSQILLQHLPGDLSGHGADFGCGYGYLSNYLLQGSGNVKSLKCIDADARALQAAQKNLAPYEDKTSYLWEDLNTPPQGVSRLDFIVMNPPFHAGKTADSDIGANFIKSASACLRKKGRLFMVANIQLPYEWILRENFFAVETLYQGEGFKVFAAAK